MTAPDSLARVIFDYFMENSVMEEDEGREHANVIAIRLAALRVQGVDPKPLPARLPRESECTAEAAHYFYAQGWNACRDAMLSAAPPRPTQERSDEG